MRSRIKLFPPNPPFISSFLYPNVEWTCNNFSNTSTTPVLHLHPPSTLLQPSNTLSPMVVLAALYVVCVHTASVDVDWADFLSRQSPVWNRTTFLAWEDGPFFGNGLVGGILRLNSTDPANPFFHIDVGRSDVWDQRRAGRGGYVPGLPGDGTLFMRPRLPIGHIHVDLPGTIEAINITTDLHSATVSGSVVCKGENGTHNIMVQLYAVHPLDSAMVMRFEAESWQAEPYFVADISQSARGAPPGYKPNPPAESGVLDGANVTTQMLLSGGNYATALRRSVAYPGTWHVAVCMDAPQSTSPQCAANSTAYSEASHAALLSAHLEHWDAFYKKSFVSVSQETGNATILEAFYWIQMYKLGSALREDGPALDLMGPWYQPSGWLFYWLDLNMQLSYWPLYLANHLDLAATLPTFFLDERHHAQLFNNSVDGKGASIGSACPADLYCGTGNFTGSVTGNLAWVCADIWKQIARTEEGPQKAALLHKFLPYLENALFFYTNHTVLSDNVAHIPFTLSPEYPAMNPAGFDTNYDLALFRWGLETLLANYQPGLTQPESYWSDILTRLAEPPINEYGYMVNNATSFDVAHRHFSHMFHIYPLRMTHNTSLIAATLDRWTNLSCPAHMCDNGYTFSGASSVSSILGRADDAEDFLLKLLTSPKIHQSTMYSEGHSPCIESPLAVAASLLDMLLVCEDVAAVVVFPAVPTSWQNASFAGLLCDRAMVVSAQRRLGKTEFVEFIASNASEAKAVPLTATVDIASSALQGSAPYAVVSTTATTTTISATLVPGEVFVLWGKDSEKKTTVSANAANAGQLHYWGSTHG